MRFSKIMENECKSDYEVYGATEYSILSSMAAFNELGASLESLAIVNQKIRGMVATMWGMLPMLVRSGEGDSKATEMLEMLKNQLFREGDLYIEMIEALHEKAKDKVKNKCPN